VDVLHEFQCQVQVRGGMVKHRHEFDGVGLNYVQEGPPERFVL
jgi:hypothetical protein